MIRSVISSVIRSPVASALGTGGGVAFTATGLPIWTAAVRAAQAGTDDARILVAGESTMRVGGGATASNWALEATPMLLADLFDGTILYGSALDLLGKSGNTLTTIDSRVASIGSWTTGSQESLGGEMFLSTSGTTPATITLQGEYDEIELYFATIRAGSGVFTLTVDGVLIDTLSNNPAASMQRRVYSLTLASHTVSIARVSGTATWMGIHGRNTARRKVEIYNAAEGGRKAADWAVSTLAYNPLPSITAVDPHLVILDCTINSMLAATSASAIAASLETVIDYLQARDIDVLLMSANPCPTGSISLANQQACRDALAALATSKSVKFIDLFGLWGESTATVPGGMSSGVHPSQTGYAAKADIVYAAITT